MATEYGLDSGGLVLVPNTLSSTPPLVNFRMRWLPPSATYTLLTASSVTPCGVFSPGLVVW